MPLETNLISSTQEELLSGRLLHFSTLKTVGESKVTESMKKCIIQLRGNFSARFNDFAISRNVNGFVDCHYQPRWRILY